MSFQPANIKFFGNGCKLVNYLNLKSTPAYTIPKDSRSGWLSHDIYGPMKPSTAKFKTNYKYTELYNTREQYINESKKNKAPSYSFGKAIKEDEFYKKNKRKKNKVKNAKNKNINFNEENIKGDNCENIKENKKKEKEEEKHTQYYEIGTKFVNESRQQKAPLYSLAGGPFNTEYLSKRKVDNKFYPQNDYYKVNESYIKESKKPRILKYSFGKEKRLDIDNKKENNKNTNFKEEKNFGIADNCENFDNNQKRKKKGNKKVTNKMNNNSQNSPHDYYNLREHYIYESQKPRVVEYSFGVLSGIKPRIIKGKEGIHSFYELSKYIHESQKPYAPKYSFGRPRTFIPTKKKNKKYKLRPQSAVFNLNLNNYIKEEEKNEIKNNYKMSKSIYPGPGAYDIGGVIGENALKISMSPKFKSKKRNDYPGPGKYSPKFNAIKQKYPIYSIPNAEREGCYEGYYPIKHKVNHSYGVQYYKRNPSWIIPEKNKREFINNIRSENLRYI